VPTSLIQTLKRQKYHLVEDSPEEIVNSSIRTQRQNRHEKTRRSHDPQIGSHKPHTSHLETRQFGLQLAMGTDYDLVGESAESRVVLLSKLKKPISFEKT